MRIKRCTIKAYGQFRERSFDDLNHSIVVVQGRNEAGKSTFFHFLRSMLYGFYPERFVANQYAPIDGTAIEGEMALSSGEAGDLVVSRRLDKNPSGYLLNGMKDELGNRSIPQIEHISRPVFESVYTLGLYDMIEFSRDAWDTIQDRLLGSLNVGHIRTAKEAIRAIEREAGAIWHHEHSENSMLRQVELQLRDLKKCQRNARQIDQTLRELTREMASFEQEERALEEEEIKLKAELRRIKRLYPVLRLNEKMSVLRRQAEHIEEYDHIPEDPHIILDTLGDQIEKDQDKLEYAKRDIRYSQSTIQKLVKSLFTEPLSKDSLKALRDLPDVELRHHVYACQEALGNLREVQMYAKMLSVRANASKSLVGWVFVLLFAAIAIASGLYLDIVGIWMMGAIVAPISLIQIVWVLRHNRNIGYDTGEEWPDVSEYEVEAREQKHAIRDILAEIPLPEIRLENPDLELVSDIEALKVALDDYDQQVRQYAELEKEFKLSNRSTLNKIKQLKEPLLSLGDGDIYRGSRTLMARRKATRQAEQYEETLDQDYPGWRDMVAEIDAMRTAENASAFSDEDVIRLEARLEQIDTELKQVVAAKIKHSKDIERLVSEQSMRSIDSEIQLLQRRREELQQRYDRLMMLSSILRKADLQFRMKHQPEVIRLAGEYLSHVTDGRYNRLGIDEETGQLMVYARDTSQSYKVAPPLSQGTCDQIFLAIRLAIIDHLDDGKERLPVFLDEVFVNWDVSRRKNVYGILRRMAKKRQIFVFTCHPWQTQEAVDELGAYKLLLSMQN